LGDVVGMPRPEFRSQEQPYKRPALVLIALACLAVLASGCGQTSATNQEGGAPPAMPVQVIVAKTQRIPDATEYLSILKSRHSATINPQVEGQITKIFVKSGDHVRAGTPLLQIDPLKQQATVGSQDAARRAQEATLQYAQVQLDREKKLFAAGVVAKQELDNAQSTFDAAAAQLKSLEQQVTQQQVELHYSTVTSPTDGIVGDVPVRTGDRVTVASILTTVDEPGALEAYIYVPADRARELKPGAEVHLIDANGRTVSSARVTFVSPQVDTETQTVLAKAAVANANEALRVAQQVRAQVIWGSHEGTVIPVLDVTRINGQFFAFLAVNEGKGTVARQKLLRIGDTLGNDYVVVDGIRPGDHIIATGLQFLQDGAPVAEQIQGSGGSPAPTPAH
jgi:RND family efflux transporter MFP subunit